MSDKAEKKPAAAPAAEEPKDGAKKGGGLLAKTPVLLGGAMVIEAIVLFAGFKFIGGGPRQAAAESMGEKPALKAPEKKQVEVPVLDLRATNKISGRTLLFDVSISIIVKADDEATVKARITDCGALIRDRVRTIIAEIDTAKLDGGTEPGLETLKRQVKYQLDQILGDGVIQEVLIGRCTPYRADY